MIKTELYAELERIVGEGNVSVNEPMKLHTSFRIGGPADYYVRTGTVAELKTVLSLLSEAGEERYIFGRGTNLLVSDEGYRGCIVTMTGKGVLPVTDTTQELAQEMSADTYLDSIEVDGNVITAGCGASLAMAAAAARKNGLSGLEFAAGIPGSVGGGLVMNAGAYGGEISQVLVSADILTAEGMELTLSNEELRLGYRDSIIKHNNSVALSCRYELKPDSQEAISERMADFAGRRKDKQPLEYPSAGSTFKRPEGYFAGKLIMDAGLKGFCIGNACVSQKHAGFVVNKGGASAQDVNNVIKSVQKKVFEETGIRLETEVIFLGEF